MKPIINVSEATTHSAESGACFAYSMTELASELGARAIGANITRVPPGKAAFPFHHHYENEEHFFVLSGSGVLRHGEKLHAVATNDYIVNLPGGPECAHQLINTGVEDLVYLAISANEIPEVCGYPDSGNTGVRTAPRTRWATGNSRTVSAWRRSWRDKNSLRPKRSELCTAPRVQTAGAELPRCLGWRSLDG
jgi:uncharacterized cupin superfamily protein